jgi:ribosomal protein S18 acetylase RimI-like enzyme
MNIDEVSEKDIEVIKGLARRAIIESVDATGSIKDEIVTDTMLHIEKNISGSERVFLKCTDENVLGFILIQEYWNLSDLFVIPDAPGRGIGTLLFNAAMSACFSKQDKRYIRVNSSLNAEGFYRRLGFESFTPEKEAPSFVVPLIYNF